MCIRDRVKPFSLGVPAQQRICIRQLLHDARILPPGKIFHALAFQPCLLYTSKITPLSFFSCMQAFFACPHVLTI